MAVSLLVAHASDTEWHNLVKAAKDFVRSAHPDVDENAWTARPPFPRSVAVLDDVYQDMGFTVFEWEG